MPKPVVITLAVDAHALYALQAPTKQQIDSFCQISDDNNGSSPNSGPIEDFTSTVYLNNNVKWVGVSNNSGFTVSIDSIFYQADGDDVDFFDDINIFGSGGRSGNVNANVKNDNSLIGQHDDYLINFSLWDSPSTSKSYFIDPKLQINQ